MGIHTYFYMHSVVWQFNARSKHAVNHLVSLTPRLLVVTGLKSRKSYLILATGPYHGHPVIEHSIQHGQRFSFLPTRSAAGNLCYMGLSCEQRGSDLKGNKSNHDQGAGACVEGSLGVECSKLFLISSCSFFFFKLQNSRTPS